MVQGVLALGDYNLDKKSVGKYTFVLRQVLCGFASLQNACCCFCPRDGAIFDMAFDVDLTN